MFTEVWYVLFVLLNFSWMVLQSIQRFAKQNKLLAYFFFVNLAVKCNIANMHKSHNFITFRVYLPKCYQL